MHRPPNSTRAESRASDGTEPLTVSLSTTSSSQGLVVDGFPVDIDIDQRFVRHEQLGRGGFGCVYRAYDRQLDRFVAIKVPHISGPDQDRVQKRVAREATATARLRHPNIVTLLDFIHLVDHSLLINELIQGETLTRLIGRHPQGCDLRLAAAVVQRIAGAVQHAHDQSVLHRDIKPSNIMLDTTTVDGELPFCPRLTDFGLATILRDSDSEDQSEVYTETIGTWHYTPPEVISNKLNGHTTTCDIYSLGVVLYEMITGTRPFQAVTLADLLPKIGNGDFLPPGAIRGDVPRDLEAICLRCMARNPVARYPTAASLAEDLSRFLSGDTVLARMPDRSERFFRWMRRNPTPAAISAVSAIAIVVVFIVIASTNRKLFKLNSQLESMNTQLQTSLSNTRTTVFEYEQANYATDLANASSAIRQLHLRDARTLLSRYADAQPLAHHRDIEWDHNRFLITKSPTPVWNNDQPLYCLCQVDNYYCISGASSQITIIDRQTGLAVRSWATGQQEVNSLVFDAQNNLIWASGDDGSIHAYDFESMKLVHQVQAFQTEHAYDMVLFPDSSRIACISNYGTVLTVDTNAGKVLGTFEAAKREANAIAKVDHSTIAVGYFEGLIRFFDVSTYKLERETQLDSMANVNAMSRDPHKPWLWFLAGNAIRILDIEMMVATPPYNTSDEAISIAHNATDQSTVIALRGGVFHQYYATDEAELIEVDQWVNEGERVYFAAFDDLGSSLLTVGAGGNLLMWQPRPLLRTEFDAQTASAGITGVHTFQLVPGAAGQWPVVIGDQAGKLFRLDTRTTSRTELDFKTLVVNKFAVIDEHRLVLANDKSSQSIFDTRVNAFTKLPIPSVDGKSFMLSEHWFADTDFFSNRIRLIDLKNPKETIELAAYNPFCAGIALRNRQIFWNDDNSVMMRSLDASGPQKILESFSRNPWHLQLSPDESLLAIGLGDREVHLWDWRANKRVGPVMMHEGQIYAVAFSPGGRTLLTVDDSATLRFWNVTTGQQVSQTDLGITPGSLINQVRFTADGNFVVVLHGAYKITTVRIL